jgi:Raf kinase inhibitor-like YbhB/YbcL family protein
MRFLWRTGLTLVTLSLAALTAAAAQTPGAVRFTLSSTAFSSGGNIPAAQVYKGFGCSGGNLSPALAWSGAPPATESFALLVHDPDAPTGGGWWHWIVYNMPATVSSLPEGAGDGRKPLLPPGAVQGRTDFGSAAYGGPCPPPGKPHHYHFRIYALKVAKLDLPPDASAAMIAAKVQIQSLADDDLVGVYGR